MVFIQYLFLAEGDCIIEPEHIDRDQQENKLINDAEYVLVTHLYQPSTHSVLSEHYGSQVYLGYFMTSLHSRETGKSGDMAVLEHDLCYRVKIVQLLISCLYSYT